MNKLWDPWFKGWFHAVLEVGPDGYFQIWYGKPQKNLLRKTRLIRWRYFWSDLKDALTRSL